VRIRDLVTGPDGGLSHTKAWSHVGYLVGTLAFVRDAWGGGLTDMKLLVYMGVMTGAAAASKLMGLKYGGGNGDPQAPPPRSEK
jgi:hypothetical protein